MAIRKSISFYLDEELKKHISPEAKTFFLQEWYRYMFPYIPFDTGILASLTYIEDDKKNDKKIKIKPDQAMQMGIEAIDQNIHFKAPYASNQNNGDNFNFTKDLHPLAQAHWEQVAADLYGQEIVKSTKNFIIKDKLL